MTMADIIPRDMHEALRWLGKLKEDWVEVKKGSIPEHTNFRVRSEYIKKQPGFDKFKNSRVMQFIWKHNEAFIIEFFEGCSYLLANGAKIYKPLTEHMEAMSQVEINIPIADYRQPYPCLVIQVPQEYRKILGQEKGIPTDHVPQWMLVR